MKDLFYLLSIPALVLLLISRLGGSTPRLPPFLRAFFRWFGWVGNITLTIYCAVVAAYALYGLRYADQTVEIAAQIGVAILMAILAGSFWRSAKRLT